MSLSHFVQAQEPVYHQALDELRSGHKYSHWMWFIFPQLGALGRSARAQFFGLADVAQAAAYWQHPVLGPRLLDATRAMLLHPDRSAVDILGQVDALKFRSCMTLFALAVPQEPSFIQALQVFYDGKADPATLTLCGRAGFASDAL